MTAPLGWLKQNKQTFVPQLPPRLSQAIDAIGYGSLEKVKSFIILLSTLYLTSTGVPHFPPSILVRRYPECRRETFQRLYPVALSVLCPRYKPKAVEPRNSRLGYTPRLMRSSHPPLLHLRRTIDCSGERNRLLILNRSQRTTCHQILQAILLFASPLR